jgi:hypothetical protein
MSSSRFRTWGFAVMLGALCLFTAPIQSQPGKAKSPPKLEPVAETKLLMNGLAEPNCRGLSKLLAEKPREAETWELARGRALLIAETGNLLMLRPPKGKDGQETWLTLAADLREAATLLARSTADKDFLKSRSALASVANSCNHCHQSFRVNTRIEPFPDGGE